jgi:hypothetical protein
MLLNGLFAREGSVPQSRTVDRNEWTVRRRAKGLMRRADPAVAHSGLGLAALAGLTFLWAGMVLGVSFLAAPVKFQAPSLTLPVGLDVGRHVFGVFSKVELLWAVLVVSVSPWSRPDRLVRIALIVVLGVVAVQTLWLLPVLDARVEVLLAGETPQPAPYHLVYIVLEGIKLAALTFTGVRCLHSVFVAERAARGPLPAAGPPASTATRDRGEHYAREAARRG